ncbi:4Fe-4S dicluster domain-containing protein [Methanoculleus sp. Wushi-C6]|uniref:4Fe-4S dicluster domain-containing protein n=1 Tax=Methanoculleus caldifontis TaxID=2651577 RepID=A0ABU3WZV8_9EURY|nr:4Fe-4S binding protein [Methanoculleus sp. Wushi-C6]MDV2481328.1 4Fe-4S dicluster domain-containing protein [Methanoculleus sp. Wushi-C6]
MSIFQMTRTVIRNLTGGPATRQYPLVPARTCPLTRGHVVFDPATCRSCGLCSRRCPCEALHLDKETKVWAIDRMRCIACGDCVEACPFGSLAMEPAYLPPVVEQRVAECHTITYVKPEKPAKKPAEEGAGA